MEKDIYLNSSFCTRICKEALNPSVDPALIPFKKEHILDLFQARGEDTFVFTSSGAESICQVLWSVFTQICRKTGRTQIITSAIEDRAVMQMLKRLEELGCFVKIAPVTESGEIDTKALFEMITPRTALITVSMANGLTGVIQPVEEIQKIAKEKNVLTHFDATHAAGKYHFNFEELDCDYLTFSGDRLHSQIATGGLLAKPSAPLEGYILGGPDLRGGKLDPALISSLANACRESLIHLDYMSLEIARLKTHFEKKILEKIPSAKILLQHSLKLPTTCVIAFPSCHQEANFALLEKHHIHAQLGGKFEQHLYHLLLASKVPPEIASCALSFSLDRFTTKQEIDTTVGILKSNVEFLSSISQNMNFPAETQTYPQSKPGRKIREKFTNPKFNGIFTHLQAQEKGMRLVKAQEKGFSLYLLVDESDGVIADAKYAAFGPSTLIALGEILCEAIIRKNHIQANKISADFLETESRDNKTLRSLGQESNALLNLCIDTLEIALENCRDIPVTTPDFINTPIVWDFDQEGTGIEGWETFSKEQKLFILNEIIEKEIRPYVELDAGGVEIISLDDNDCVTIAYSGSCTTCISATGSTLTAIQQIFRQKVHPKIQVIPKL